MTHRVVTPKILYFGTPVVLVSTLNEDGTPNLAPMSSAWWLGTSCVLGLSARSHTVHNLRRHGECVLNLPSADMVDAVDRLALLTGSDPIPEYKQAMGYRHEPRKFAVAGLTPVPSDVVAPPRVHECPVQMEAVVRQMHPVGGPDRHLAMIEVSVERVHADEDILVPGHPSHFDPDRWRPLIMSFCEFYGLGGKIHPSRLAAAYAPPAEEAQDLWDDIPVGSQALPLDDEQRRELERRLTAHRADPASAVPWDEARARLRERFGA